MPLLFLYDLNKKHGFSECLEINRFLDVLLENMLFYDFNMNISVLQRNCVLRKALNTPENPTFSVFPMELDVYFLLLSIHLNRT